MHTGTGFTAILKSVLVPGILVAATAGILNPHGAAVQPVPPPVAGVEQAKASFIESIIPIHLSGNTVRDGALLFLGFAALAGAGFLIYTRRNKRIVHSTSPGKRIVLLAEREKMVKHGLTNATVTLARTLEQHGLHVLPVRSCNKLGNMLIHPLPDLIIADWLLRPTIQSQLERLLSRRSSTAAIPVVFYNTVKLNRAREESILPNVHFLGTVWNDASLFRMIRPLLGTDQGTRTIPISVNRIGLQGDIQRESLSQIMEFIERTEKSGALVISVGSRRIGTVYFESGRIIHAETPQTTGRQALFFILELTSGAFRFQNDIVPPRTTLNYSPLEVLLQWTKGVDETNIYRLRKTTHRAGGQ